MVAHPDVLFPRRLGRSQVSICEPEKEFWLISISDWTASYCRDDSSPVMPTVETHSNQPDRVFLWPMRQARNYVLLATVRDALSLSVQARPHM